MMGFEEFRKKADTINWNHRNDPQSKEHIQELMRLYSDYGNVRLGDISEQPRSVSGESDSRDGTDRDNESDEA